MTRDYAAMAAAMHERARVVGYRQPRMGARLPTRSQKNLPPQTSLSELRSRYLAAHPRAKVRARNDAL